MNLVISGPIDATLRNLIVALSKPRRVVPLHARADRLEGADDTELVRRQVAVMCDAARVDHAYIEEGVRFSDFKLLAMDMDSTLITIECIDEIADFAGKKAEVAAITEAAMRGEIDFAESLRQRVALLAGVHCNCLREVYSERLKLTSGAIELINAAKRAGIYLLLISGGFTFFSERLKDQLAFDETCANTLEISNNLITGRLSGDIVDAAAKASHVVKIAQRRNAQRWLVIGDGANDIPMMLASPHSIAFHAKTPVQAVATSTINFGDLRLVLDYYQA